eukprot:1194528-Prorocentrum_minimum.AAC.11
MKAMRNPASTARSPGDAPWTQSSKSSARATGAARSDDSMAPAYAASRLICGRDNASPTICCADEAIPMSRDSVGFHNVLPTIRASDVLSLQTVRPKQLRMALGYGRDVCCNARM